MCHWRREGYRHPQLRKQEGSRVSPTAQGPEGPVERGCQPMCPGEEARKFRKRGQLPRVGGLFRSWSHLCAL